ncbi:hypothetical protein HCU40_24225 [Pseudanabaena biceps]|nr:hypothetical protein [Pseudanabaena biceps]
MAKVKQPVQLSGEALLKKVKELDHLSKKKKLRLAGMQQLLKTTSLVST